MTKITREMILKHIAPIEDPEMHLGLVDLGLIYDVDISDDAIARITMTLTSPMCPIGPEIAAMVKDRVEQLEGVKEAIVDLVWDPPWNPAEMASDAAKDELGIW